MGLAGRGNESGRRGFLIPKNADLDKDDVEFPFDEEARAIHFRSSSRVDYSEMGVNRKRMLTVSRRYLETLNRQG
ncbi:MAG TPA: DUF1499 domain-containing protein [Phycisphaerae bacterium]|nr:DUF1499 domain-containing protein [Phycisphaerae bacterium]